MYRYYGSHTELYLYFTNKLEQSFRFAVSLWFPVLSPCRLEIGDLRYGAAKSGRPP